MGSIKGIQLGAFLSRAFRSLDRFERSAAAVPQSDGQSVSRVRLSFGVALSDASANGPATMGKLEMHTKEDGHGDPD